MVGIFVQPLINVRLYIFRDKMFNYDLVIWFLLHCSTLFFTYFCVFADEPDLHTDSAALLAHDF